jgi:integrase
MLSKEIVAELSKTLVASSVKRYKAWSNKISPDEYDVENFVNFYKKIDEEFKQRKDYTSILAVIIKVLKLENKPTEIYEKLLKEGHETKDLYSKPTETDKEKQITVESILQLKQETKEKMEKKHNKKTAYELQFLTMITDLAPFRTQDYINVSFSPNETKNYVDIENKRLVYTEGKTLNSNRVIDLPDELFNLIKTNKEKYESKFLFPSFRIKGQSITDDGFVSFTKRLFNGDVSPQILRQIFVSHYNDTNMSKKDRIVKSKMMGHALNTSQTKYTKFSSAIHDKDALIDELQQTIKELKAQLEAQLKTK